MNFLSPSRARASDSHPEKERERAAKEAEEREHDIARGNPLLNPVDFNVKRRWAIPGSAFLESLH